MANADRYRHVQWLIYGTALATLAVLALTLLFALDQARARDRDRLDQARARALDQRKAAIQTRLVICRELNKLKQAARTALEKQVADSEQFLRLHPNGIPGISPELIRRSVRRLRIQIVTNANVDCVVFAHNPTQINPKRSAAGG